MRKLILLVLGVSLLLPFRTMAQEDLVEYLPAGETDAKFLIDNYLSIMSTVVESGLNSGWYTTGDPHYKFGFELNIAMNTIFIPSKEDYFSAQGKLTNATMYTDPTMLPTGYGPEEVHPRFYVLDPFDNTDTVKFRGPDGNNLKDEFLINAVVVPSIQLGIGIPYNMDIKVRYTPKYDYGDVSFGNWGVGLMHSIRQHIPALKVLPFGWSLFIAYSRLNGEVDLSGRFPKISGSSNTDDQVGEFHVNTWTFQTIASKDFSIFTVYGGIGYNIGNTEFDLRGTYDINLVNTGLRDSFDQAILAPVTTPIQVDMDQTPYHFAYNSKSLRMTLGLRMKLGPVIFFGDYTLQRTSVLSFGMGFTFKEDEF